MSKDSDEIISIKVAGVEYQLHCPKDEQRGLLNAADYLNKKVKLKTKYLKIERTLIHTLPNFVIYIYLIIKSFLEKK